MNLCIDQGNTYTKIGIFEAENLLHTALFSRVKKEDFLQITNEYRIKKVIISSVQKTDSDLRSLLESKTSGYMELSHTSAIPIKNLYETPETLGKDRLAGVIGATSLHPKKDILVIDAGTALTFDFINKKSEYLGGSISPGLHMRIKALHTFTQKLPLVHNEGPYTLLARNTEQAIRSGVINGICFEIDAYINELQKTYPELLIFLTGGDCFFFESKLKNRIFANQNLVLIGLNRIINYNA